MYREEKAATICKKKCIYVIIIFFLLSEYAPGLEILYKLWQILDEPNPVNYAW